MNTIQKYVFSSFFTAFMLAWLVLSFVITIGLLVKIAQLMIQGLPAHTIGVFMLIGFPEMLSLTIPLALLVSALLVFSRLSADSEIAAMRACGINLLSVMKYPILFAVFCTFIGFYINNEIVPRAHEARYTLKNHVSVDVGLDLLEPGRMIDDFEKVKLFFARKEGNWLYDILAFDYATEGVTREIKAEKALVSTNGSDIVLDMYKVRVDPIDVHRPGAAMADRLRHVIPNAMRMRAYARNERDLRFWELREYIEQMKYAPPKDQKPERVVELLSAARTQYSKRFMQACACFCFVLIGIPLGIKTHRKESTIGMAVSLVVALSYYLLMLLADSNREMAFVYPHLLIWLPVLACFGLAAYLIPKNL